jgi:hypothetical protein
VRRQDVHQAFDGKPTSLWCRSAEIFGGVAPSTLAASATESPSRSLLSVRSAANAGHALPTQHRGWSRPWRYSRIHPRPARVDAFPYDVTADGQRILVNTFVEEVTPPITLIVNWEPKR